MKQLIPVKTYNKRIEAEVAQGLLRSNGIKSLITADDAGGMYPFPFQPGFTGVTLLVDKKQMLKARQLLNQKR